MQKVKKPTLRQKKAITAAGLDWHTWNVANEDNIGLLLISKRTGRKRLILK